MLRLAEYQIRLLLCTPDRRGFRAGRLQLAWNCGCRATECDKKKFAVQACEAHGYLLDQVTEGEERPYDGIAGSAFVASSGRGSV